MPQSPISVSYGKTAGNAQRQALVGAQGDTLVSFLHGSKYAPALADALFSGANASGVTTSVALATTYVGLCLSNPAANTKNLILRRVAFAVNVAFAALTNYYLISGFIAAGIVTHTTPVTPISQRLGSATVATGKLDAACTLVGTPRIAQQLAEAPAATNGLAFTEDFNGSFVLLPGSYVAIGSSIAGPTSGFFASMEWEEY